jgi:hypothetical protein
MRHGVWLLLAVAVLLPGGASATAPPPSPHVWVHYDYVVNPDGHSDAPDPAAIQLVVDAYAAHGIVLEVDSHHTAVPSAKPNISLKQADNCAALNLYAVRAQYFHPTSNHEWHYALFGDDVASSLSANCASVSGEAEQNGDNFVIGMSTIRRIGIYGVGGTFMHELGHNLGLLHGGNVGANFKPNYLSVMNYRFQSGIPYASTLGSTSLAGHRLDYSGTVLPTLDEAHLNETLGIQAGSTDITLFDIDPHGFGFGVGPASGPIDWNLNGTANEADVEEDLDAVPFCADCLLGLEQMTGFDDWAEVRGYVLGTIVHGPKTITDENHANEPIVTAISPATGPATGGTLVTINGDHLGKATEVVFGAAGAAHFTIVDAKTITAVAPPASLGGYTTDVTVVSGLNPSPSVAADVFAYTGVLPVINGVSPASGPGGTIVTITGANFTGATDVGFYFARGAGDAGQFAVIDDSTIRASATVCCFFGASHVLVRNAYGANPFDPLNFSDTNDIFTFSLGSAPTVTSVSPSSGPAAGGTAIVIKGTGLSGVSSITIGGYALVANFTIVDDSTISAVTATDYSPVTGEPIVATGDLTVTTFYGSSAPSANDLFTFVP